MNNSEIDIKSLLDIPEWERFQDSFAKLTGIMEGLRNRNFHDREAAEKEYGVRFTEGQEEDFLFTAAQYS